MPTTGDTDVSSWAGRLADVLEVADVDVWPITRRYRMTDAATSVARSAANVPAECVKP